MVTLYTFPEHHVKKDAAGGLVLVRDADGLDFYFQPGDEASAFGDQCRALESGQTPPSNIASILEEYLDP